MVFARLSTAPAASLRERVLPFTTSIAVRARTRFLVSAAPPEPRGVLMVAADASPPPVAFRVLIAEFRLYPGESLFCRRCPLLRWRALAAVDMVSLMPARGGRPAVAVLCDGAYVAPRRRPRPHQRPPQNKGISATMLPLKGQDSVPP